MSRHASVPPGLTPRLIAGKDAAKHVGVCLSMFRRLVTDGKLPQPIRWGRRLVWDRVALDRRLDELSGLAAPARASAKAAIMEAIRGAG